MPVFSPALTRPRYPRLCSIFFFNDTATTEIYTLSLHDALPISGRPPLVAAAASPLLRLRRAARPFLTAYNTGDAHGAHAGVDPEGGDPRRPDRRGRGGRLVPGLRPLARAAVPDAGTPRRRRVPGREQPDRRPARRG